MKCYSYFSKKITITLFRLIKCCYCVRIGVYWETDDRGYRVTGREQSTGTLDGAERERTPQLLDTKCTMWRPYQTSGQTCMYKILLEIPPVNECDFSESLKSTSWEVWFHESTRVERVKRVERGLIHEITPTNALISVIQEKSHEFTVGFPFNTRV